MKTELKKAELIKVIKQTVQTRPSKEELVKAIDGLSKYMKPIKSFIEYFEDDLNEKNKGDNKNE